MYSTVFVVHSSSSSSPPSSPAAFIDSSSPVSSLGSDGAEIYQDNDIPPMSLARDPFSASSNNWKPPEYEKKRPSSPTTPSNAPKKLRYHRTSGSHAELSSTNGTYLSSVPTVVIQNQAEAGIWEKASESIIDEGNGRVSLENSDLTHIPESFIEVLSLFWTSSARSDSDYVLPTLRTPTVPSVTRPLNRASTEPAGADIWGRPMLRTQSVATVPLGLPKNKIQLFLSNNNISVIPLSLFRSGNLENLTILSLRNNKLTHIPPEIVQLRGLEELSIGQNRIRYLPAEMLQMNLKSLYVIPNPFKAPPPSLDPCSLGSSTIISQVPPLNELLLRLLLSPVDPTKPSSQTVLESHYILPLPEELPALHSTEHSPSQKIHFPWPLPPFARRTLDVCLPGSVYLEEDTDTTTTRYAADVTGVGLCPSPKHQRLGTSRLFIQHAEERYTWETMIAGVEVGSSVPMRWRGCQLGCLNFLDPPEEKSSVPQLSDMSQGEQTADSGRQDEDINDVVQVVQLSMTGNGGLEEFDDE
ncbi:Protein lap1 [Termitomyces sp. J132]|nr:Protein lap1 [Termitomyces sp. J132]